MVTRFMLTKEAPIMTYGTVHYDARDDGVLGPAFDRLESPFLDYGDWDGLAAL